MFEEKVLTAGCYQGNVELKVNISNVIFTKTNYISGTLKDTPHSHENPHIAFILHGGDIEKRNKNNYRRTVGDVYFYNSGETHQTISRTQFSKNLNIEFLPAYLMHLKTPTSKIENSIKKNTKSKFLLLNILRELTWETHQNPDSIVMLLNELIFSSTNYDSLKTPKWVKNLYEILNDRWNENIALDELSSILKVHPVTISKHFRKYFNCTYGEYMLRLKINRSISLVKNSNNSLTEITYICGFADQSHFTRNFKRLTGYLPKDFQRIH